MAAAAASSAPIGDLAKLIGNSLFGGIGFGLMVTMAVTVVMGCRVLPASRARWDHPVRRVTEVIPGSRDLLVRLDCKVRRDQKAIPVRWAIQENVGRRAIPARLA